MASRICLERLGSYEDGLKYAKEALDAAIDANDVLNAARAHLCMVTDQFFFTWETYKLTF